MPSTTSRPSKLFSAGRAARTASSRVIPWSPSFAASVPLLRSSDASTRFIAGLPMKPADEEVRRVGRRAPAAAPTCCSSPSSHDRDAVAHRHRLDLVVRDVDRRHAERALEPGDLGAHLHAQLGVEVRERLVHQEDLRLADDRAAQRDPLPLPARERSRLAVEQLLEAEDLRRLAGRAARSPPSASCAA